MAQTESAVGELVEVMRRLRAQCPWKREQTHRSLVRYLLEETAETVDAIDGAETSGDYAHLAEELGDVLLQVVFHAAIAEERGDFDLDAVARGITAKMRRRNPHVFGEVDPSGLDAEAVNALWQQAKQREKVEKGPTVPAPDAGIGAGLSALLFADKVVDRSERAGTPVQVDPSDNDLGEQLLALVLRARAEDVDPEQALRDAVRRRL